MLLVGVGKAYEVAEILKLELGDVLGDALDEKKLEVVAVG
jgi:hypothetical protein